MNTAEEIKKDAIEAILNVNDSEREGEIIDILLIKNIVKLFDAIGTYIADLEELLARTREFYAQRRQEEWTATDLTPDYLIKAEAAFIHERNRVAEYLIPSTEEKLMKMEDEEILEKVATEFLENEESGCRALMDNGNSDDLHHIMFRLFS